jgi:hypothetical protein
MPAKETGGRRLPSRFSAFAAFLLFSEKLDTEFHISFNDMQYRRTPYHYSS